MKIKTSELQGAALDWAVAKCEGRGIEFEDPRDPWLTLDGIAHQPLHSYTPSTDWAQGGPIIEREKISVWYRVGVRMFANIDGKYEQSIAHDHPGNTQLIVAMRCYVASKLGDEVEVPDGLN